MTKVDDGFWARFDEQLQEATRAALGYYNTTEKPQTPAAKLAMGSLDTVWPIVGDIGERCGWSPLSWFRREHERTTVVVVQRRRCGHRMWFALEEEAMCEAAEAGPRSVVDYLYNALSVEPQKGCACFEDIALPEGK